MTSSTDHLKLDEINVIFHKHNISLQYMYGKGITSVFEISMILSPNAPRYQGFKFQDEIYIISSSLKSKMLLKKDDRYRLLKDSNPSNLMDFGDLAKGTRYGIGVRVMDFYWVSGGSVHSHTEGEIYTFLKKLLNCLSYFLDRVLFNFQLWHFEL